MEEDDRLSFETVDEGVHFPAADSSSEARVRLLKSEEEWQLFLARTGLSHSAPVSFEGAFLVAVIDQTQPSGGFTLSVESVLDTEGGVLVRAVRSRPGPECMVTMALTRPYQIVRIEGEAASSARLEIEERVQSCR